MFNSFVLSLFIVRIVVYDCTESGKTMYEELKSIIDKAGKIVFFGGAGVSTESGIPDFRSESGLYHAQKSYGYSPEIILSEEFFQIHPDIFFRYYKDLFAGRDSKPNRAHLALAMLERQGKLVAIITQNIDGLHQLAGSSLVHELHGTIQSNTCLGCGAVYTLEYMLDEGNYDSGLPRCARCGSVIKPDIVLYGGMLDEDCISRSIEAIASADVLIVGGTSLVVYPAAGFIQYFSGEKLVLINKTETGLDSRADLVIHEAIGEVLGTCLNVK